jgi:hypothetical protein
MFITELVVREGRNQEWELVEDLVYEGIIDQFRVPATFTTDFASVPRPLWSIVPPTGLYTKAAVIHDWLYVSQSVSRRDADGIFRRIMREAGVGKPKRYIMWAAVRLFGGFVWKK